MECRITILCENTVQGMGLLGEHGFSALIETPARDILFDTGQGYGLIHNSLRLGKDLRSVSKLVLSHGHLDHVGGLLAFLELKGACPVVAHPDVFTERFWLMPAAGGEEKPVSVGIPWHKTFLTTHGVQFAYCRDFEEVAPNVFITGEVPRRTLFELGSPKFVVAGEGGWVTDPFPDDFSMVLKTSRGLVIVLGCAHAGLVNILHHAVERTGENRIHAILGGTHLGLSPDGQLNPTIQALKDFDIRVLAVSHCTGQGPIARLASEFGERFAFGRVGFEIEI